MSITKQEGLQDRPGPFSPALRLFALQSLNKSDEHNTAGDRYAGKPIEFAYRREEEFARMLDEHQILWQYKHRTFAVEWDDEGNFVDSFTPDFYLPAFDKYIELVGSDYRAKARKVRLLRAQHSEIRIELLNTDSPSFLIETSC